MNLRDLMFLVHLWGFPFQKLNVLIIFCVVKVNVWDVLLAGVQRIQAQMCDVIRITRLGLWRPCKSPQGEGWVFVCWVSAWPLQINTILNSWGGEHTYSTFSHPYPCFCTSYKAHTRTQTHKGVPATLTPAMHKQHKTPQKLQEMSTVTCLCFYLQAHKL